MTSTSATTLLTPPATRPAAQHLPLAEIRGGLRLVQVRDDLSRVTTASGEVLGYVERHDDPQGDRWRAKRFLARQRRFVEIGDFWSRSDATDCFRFA